MTYHLPLPITFQGLAEQDEAATLAALGCGMIVIANLDSKGRAMECEAALMPVRAAYDYAITRTMEAKPRDFVMLVPGEHTTMMLFDWQFAGITFADFQAVIEGL